MVDPVIDGKLETTLTLKKEQNSTASQQRPLVVVCENSKEIADYSKAGKFLFS